MFKIKMPTDSEPGESLLPGLQTATVSLSPDMAFPWCLSM